MKRKRILSALLAAVLALSSIPMAIAAAPVTTTDIDGAAFTDAVSAESKVGSFEAGNKYLYVTNRYYCDQRLWVMSTIPETDSIQYEVKIDYATPFSAPNLSLDNNQVRIRNNGTWGNDGPHTFDAQSAWSTVTYSEYAEGDSNKLALGMYFEPLNPWFPPFDQTEMDSFPLMVDNIRFFDKATGEEIFTVDFENLSNDDISGGVLGISVPDVTVGGVTYSGGGIYVYPMGIYNIQNKMEIREDSDYYIASTDANHEIGYDCDLTLELGTHTVRAIVRNGQYIRSSSVNATNFIVEDGTLYVTQDNNKFDLGANFYAVDGTPIECDTVVTNIGNDWTAVEFTFELEEEVQVNKFAFEAHHILENATFGARLPGTPTPEDLADANAELKDLAQTVIMDFKNVKMTFEPLSEDDEKVSGGGIFMVLLCKKKAMVTE